MTYKKFKRIFYEMTIYRQNELNCHRENCFKYKCVDCPDNKNIKAGGDYGTKGASKRII
jgi:hypothetical protein